MLLGLKRLFKLFKLFKLFDLQKMIEAVFHELKLRLKHLTCLYDLLRLCFTRMVITDAHRVTRYVAEQFTRE